MEILLLVMPAGLGGNMVKKMIQFAESNMSGTQNTSRMSGSNFRSF